MRHRICSFSRYRWLNWLDWRFRSWLGNYCICSISVCSWRNNIVHKKFQDYCLLSLTRKHYSSTLNTISDSSSQCTYIKRIFIVQTESSGTDKSSKFNQAIISGLVSSRLRVASINQRNSVI